MLQKSHTTGVVITHSEFTIPVPTQGRDGVRSSAGRRTPNPCLVDLVPRHCGECPVRAGAVHLWAGPPPSAESGLSAPSVLPGRQSVVRRPPLLPGPPGRSWRCPQRATDRPLRVVCSQLTLVRRVSGMVRRKLACARYWLWGPGLPHHRCDCPPCSGSDQPANGPSQGPDGDHGAAA